MLSPLAARKAEKLGFKNVKVFHAGLPAWKKDGQPIVSNIAGLDNFIAIEASHILIDLRPAQAVARGHIPKAVSLPESGIETMKDQFPKHKAAPIILYNQHGDLASAEKVSKTISGWGYTQVSILQGGFEAWEKAQKAVAKGPADSTIAYVRKLMPGEADLDVFKVTVGKPAGDVIILDVRGTGEVTEGALPGTLNIPLDALEQRLAEIPKDKKVLIHCSTGARAEMAYSILKKAGYDAKFVKAKVDFDKEQKEKFSITE